MHVIDMYVTIFSAGTYLYINGAMSLPQGSIAQAVSPTLSATSSTGACMRFWYYISGSNTGTINAYVQQVSMECLLHRYVAICLLKWGKFSFLN